MGIGSRAFSVPCGKVSEGLYINVPSFRRKPWTCSAPHALAMAEQSESVSAPRFIFALKHCGDMLQARATLASDIPAAAAIILTLSLMFISFTPFTKEA